MNDVQLENLLRETVQTMSPPALPADLAELVRRRYFRRKKTLKLGGGMALTAVLVCAGIYYSSFILHPSSFPTTSPALALEERIERLNQKLDQLETKVRDQEKMLAQMTDYQKALDAGGPLAAEATDFGMALRQRIQAEQAGYMLVGLGEDYLALSQPAQAAKNFKKTVDYFPNTAAAEKAKEYLSKLAAH